MNSKKLHSVVNYILLLLLKTIIVTGCSNKSGSSGNSKAEPVNAEPGWDVLFDGESLDKWEVTSFGTEGPVSISDEILVLGMGDGCTGVTWNGSFPRQNYELQLEAKKIAGNDFFCGITFPVDTSYCSFIVGGWGGPVVGISSIDGKDASENETRTLMKFDHDTWYRIRLMVSDNKIEAWIDSVKIVDLNTRGRQLSTRPEVDLSKPFGICSWTTTAALRNIRIKKLE